MVLRPVLEPPHKQAAPYQAKATEADETPSPSGGSGYAEPPQHVPGGEHETRGERPSEPRRRPHDPLYAHAFLAPEPCREGLREVGKTARLARCEQKLRGGEGC